MRHKKNPYIAYQLHKQGGNLSNHTEEPPLTDQEIQMMNSKPEGSSQVEDGEIDKKNGQMETDAEAITSVNMEQSAQETDVAALQAALNDEKLRMLAEMDNFKKRMLREKEEQIRFAAEAVLADLLPSLDNFELALSYGKTNEACREMLQGLEMTHKLLLDALAAHGLERVGQVGEEFNPEIHEALTRENRDDMPPGHVAQLFQPGYRLKDRLLRPAKVVVSS